jgi:hypothetical protein
MTHTAPAITAGRKRRKKMAVIFVGLFDQSGSMDQQFHREYRRVFRVVVNNPLDSDISILMSGRLPLVNSSHPDDIQALAQKPEVTLPDQMDPNLRHVTIPYSTRTLDPSRQNQSPNETPIQEPPKATWGWAQRTRLFTQTADRMDDAAGVGGVRLIQAGQPESKAFFANLPNGLPATATGWPVQNTAGAPFDEDPTVEEYHQTLTVVRNEMTFDPDEAESYINHTNLTKWFPGGKLALPGEALCTEFRGERSHQKRIPFWIVTYAFEFAHEWDIIIPDKGPYAAPNSPGGGNPFNRQLANDGTAIGLARLNGAGGFLPQGQPPMYLGFRSKKRAEFNALNLINL